MIVIISTESSEYKIKPMDNELCYQIFRKKYKNNSWTFTGKYPVSIPDAMRLVIDLILKDPYDKTTKVEVKKLNQAAKTIDATIKKLIDDIVITVQEKEEEIKNK